MSSLPSQAGLYRAPGADGTDLHAEAEQRGWDGALVDGGEITGKDGLLDALARALRFPDWYGRNWDALADCLTDLSWLPAEAHVVVWTEPDRLAGADPAAFTTAVDILAHAVDYWRHAGHRFIVVFAGDHPLLATLPVA